MNATTTYAIDIAKNVMQLHWVEPSTGEIMRKKLSRAKFGEFVGQLLPARIVMEACGGAHHWGRSLMALGHQVELLPARQVRAFVRGNKDDAADARAIWLAAHQSDIRLCDGWLERGSCSRTHHLAHGPALRYGAGIQRSERRRV